MISSESDSTNDLEVESTSESEPNHEIEMVKSYIHPEVTDPQFLYKTFKKKEINYYRAPPRPDITDYDEVKKYRDGICRESKGAYNHQNLVSNFINPNTPYFGICCFWGLGVGKTFAGIAIAEQFRQQVRKYASKITILVPGPILKESWKKAIVRYNNGNLDNKNEVAAILQDYNIMSYKSFVKRVLGERVVEKVLNDDKVKVTYKKTEEGEFLRDPSINRLYNLDNTALIVDEVHNFTGNSRGKALREIIKNSKNMKLVLLTGTPMKNFADDIVELINFLRPQDSPIEREKIFTADKNTNMQLKPGGLEYFKNMVRGYVSHVKGYDPLIFAKKIDKGVIPKSLQFTYVIQCYMLPFQYETYVSVLSAEKESAIRATEDKQVSDYVSDEEEISDDDNKKESKDTLYRRSSAVANFVFPILSPKKEIIGHYGKEGLNILKSQIQSNNKLLNDKINEKFFKNKYNGGDLVTLSADGKTISGDMLKFSNLKLVSIKFYKTMKKISRLYEGKKGARTAFVYSSLVVVGILLFQEMLLMNGYLEFQEDASNYVISGNTRCYYCGKTFSQHTSGKATTTNGDDFSDDSSDDEKNKEIKSIKLHKFYPATFLVITGKLSDEGEEAINDDKKRILDEVFNQTKNMHGQYIKLVLGSRVMTEGTNLMNVGEEHILDVNFNLGQIDQIIGRGIRNCSHYNMITNENKFPTVPVYKYAITLKGGETSSDEDIYAKAEMKYKLIKKIERAMKEEAIDCAANMPINIFKEDVDKYKDCEQKGNCPDSCDYTSCLFKCSDVKLNHEYYDPGRMMYKRLSKNEIDKSTYSDALARNEINIIKNKIKEMFFFGYVFTLKDIVDYVKSAYSEYNSDFFDVYYVYRALDELMPIDENDVNDVIHDKFNRRGYIIYRNNNYIYQPIGESENISLYYRSTNNIPLENKVSFTNYLKNLPKYNELKSQTNISVNVQDNNIYDFDTNAEYYEHRAENKYVGIIDKNNQKSKTYDQANDVFKIREKRSKILNKKREAGLPTLKGSVCFNSKDKVYINKLAHYLEIPTKDMKYTRTQVCDLIKNKLLLLEKYSTGKDKLTYIILPSNHVLYPFPYNLEDRVEHVINELKNNIKIKIDYKKKVIKKTIGDEKGMPSYLIYFKDVPELKQYENLLNKHKAKKENGEIHILLE